ncbi:MAG: hypothetical protein KAY37_12285 [Phycisphaerae bacterium]|nr:hypothetical protein [Phycisphaerae bacterium]
MGIDDPNELDAVDRKIRFNELLHEAGGLEGEISDDCPPEVADQFMQHVLDYERAPLTSHFEQLLATGLELPAPEELTDAELTAKLWELIERLATLRVFLEQTDHLSDRELYTQLWADVLREEIKDLPRDEHSAWHIDMLGSCSEEDLHLAYKYYADEEERRQWLEEFPDFEMPEHVDPPYDRDRRLPRVTYHAPDTPDFDTPE